MVRRHIGKKASHHRMQGARDVLHEAGPFREAHHTEPKRHDPDQAERDRNRSLRSVERAGGHLIQSVIPPANRDRKEHEGEPDVIQHSGFYSVNARSTTSPRA